MLYAIKGKVSEIEKKKIIIQTTDFDFEIFVSKPETYLIGQYVYLFLHHVIKEDDEYLVGFRNKEEKRTFNLIINVQGIGPKSALAILSNTTYEQILTSISNNDFEALRAIPGVTSHMAAQMMLDLKQYITKSNKENNELFKEVRSALKALQFRVNDIDRVLLDLYLPNATKDSLLREALRRLRPNA